MVQELLNGKLRYDNNVWGGGAAMTATLTRCVAPHRVHLGLSYLYSKGGVGALDKVQYARELAASLSWWFASLRADVCVSTVQIRNIIRQLVARSTTAGRPLGFVHAETVEELLQAAIAAAGSVHGINLTVPLGSVDVLCYEVVTAITDELVKNMRRMVTKGQLRPYFVKVSCRAVHTVHSAHRGGELSLRY